MQVIGADIGYGFTKVVAGQVAIGLPGFVVNASAKQYPSVIAPDLATPITVELEEGKQRNHAVTYQGKRFLYGEAALRGRRSQSPPRHRAFFLESNMCAVLLLSTLSRVDGERIFYVTGLPVKYFENEDTKLKYEDRVKSVLSEVTQAEVTIVPQAMGAFYHVVLDATGRPIEEKMHLWKQARCAIVDIGHFTTDIIELDSGVPVHTSSVEVGVSLACETIAREVNRKFGIELTLHQAERALHAKKIMLYGEAEDISDIVRYAKDYAFDQVMGIVTDAIGRGENFNLIIFCGGGSILFEQRISATYKKGAYFPQFPAFANAYGYYKYGLFKVRSKLGRR